MDSIKKRIEYIVEQLKKLDCFVSAEYLRLFQDEQFLSLLYQYIDNRFNEEICTLIAKEGIRLIDLQNCAKIVCDDRRGVFVVFDNGFSERARNYAERLSLRLGR